MLADFLQGYYDAGESPLALWLKPADVPDVLGVPVSLPPPPARPAPDVDMEVCGQAGD